MSIEALKEKARKHEQNEDWGEALQVYVDAINRQTDNDQPDLGLYNRAGDLSTRIGDSVGAIEYYEQAVDLYLEAELPNNAIAILKKILRNLPQRSEVFLRMGQIRAQQGFLTDARNNFLTYAERRQQEGDMDEAFRALEEFADVAPGDVEVRVALGEQLHSHERTPEALQQLSLAYHQYATRGEGEAAQRIETRIVEIDSAFVIPAVADLGASSFETNALGQEGAFEVDSPVEAAFDEIAFDGDDEIAFEPVALDGPEELALDGPADIELDGIELPVASFAETELAEAELAEAELAETELDESAYDPEADDDDVFGFADPDEKLDFAAAVFGDDPATESSDAEDEITFADEGEVVEAIGFDKESGLVEDNNFVEASAPALELGTEESLSDQDDWDIGTDIEDAFISFDAPVSAESEPIESSEVDSGDAAEIEAQGEDGAENLGWNSSDSSSDDLTEDDGWSAEADPEDAEQESVEAELESDGFDDLPLVAFDDEESFDSEAPAAAVSLDGHDALEAATLPETESAVALEEQLDEEEVDALDWQETAAASDDLWREVSDPEVEDHVADASVAEVDGAEVEAAEAIGDDDVAEDEWIGLKDESEASDAPDADELAVSEPDEWASEESDSVTSEETSAPALADFEAFSISDLREYVRENQGVGPAWERIGRVSLEQGNGEESQKAFEEAHMAYANGQDFMSAMRCVRELLLSEPDQMIYHQRLVEYASHADDRTLLVSAYLELADCLARTGAPAKARAVRDKVLAIDPTNRRAAAAINDADEAPEGPPEAASSAADTSYVDLGSMVIDRAEKTTRWTVESEEPVGEADFDFQNMLAQFKAKVAENVDVGDVKAHYDLGTAYKEMGLVDEAITEFQAALRADGQNLATYEMLGQCFMDKGQPDVAVRSLTRATEMPFDVEDELLGIYYYLGRAHEALGNSDDAIEYFEKIFALDINFEDVTERLRALR